MEECSMRVSAAAGKGRSRLSALNQEPINASAAVVEGLSSHSGRLKEQRRHDKGVRITVARFALPFQNKVLVVLVKGLQWSPTATKQMWKNVLVNGTLNTPVLPDSCKGLVIENRAVIQKVPCLAVPCRAVLWQQLLWNVSYRRGAALSVVLILKSRRRKRSAQTDAQFKQ
ncbi:uncharacterized protein V6R79_018098 [Siganus canaliculatus]